MPSSIRWDSEEVGSGERVAVRQFEDPGTERPSAESFAGTSLTRLAKKDMSINHERQHPKRCVGKNAGVEKQAKV